jgi:hypothetical protein
LHVQFVSFRPQEFHLLVHPGHHSQRLLHQQHLRLLLHLRLGLRPETPEPP